MKMITNWINIFTEPTPKNNRPKLWELLLVLATIAYVMWAIYKTSR